MLNTGDPVVGVAGTLSHEEQAELFRRTKNPHSPAEMAAARETLILRNLPLARKKARERALATGEDFGPILSHATLGLIDAVDRFRPELGWKFSTFARHYIGGYILRGGGDERGVIRLPAHIRSGGRYEADDEFGRAARRSRTTATAAVDEAAVAAEPDGPDFGERGEVSEAVLAAVDALPERLAVVVRARFGLGGGEPATMPEIGRAIGTSKQRVKQYQDAAIRALRAALLAVHPAPDDLAPPGGPCRGCGGAPGEGGDLCRDCLGAAAARAKARAARMSPTITSSAPPCLKCGTRGGPRPKGYHRPARVRGLCKVCYRVQARSTPVAHFAPPKEAAPC